MLTASDDHDGSGYLDYVVSGGSGGTAHIWMFDVEGPSDGLLMGVIT